MTPLLAWALEWVTTYGPWVVLLMTFVETGFLVGLVLPAGPTIVFGTVLAVQGHFSVAWVFAATALGGFLGDQVGFVWGRQAGRRVLEGKGKLARAAARQWPRAEELFGKHPIYAVSFARLISFVRTLMPIAAGMSRTRYRSYVFYDLIGVAAWSSAHIAVGVLAGESWQRMVGLMGAGWAAIFFVLGAVLYVIHRRKARRKPPAAAPVAQGGES